MGRFRSSFPRSRLPLHRRLIADPGLVRRWAGVVVLAALTATLVQRVLADAEAARHRWGDTSDVLVVTRSVDEGDRLAGAVRKVPWPLALAPDGALTQLPDDARAAVAADVGAPVTPGLLAPEDRGEAADRRRVAVPVGLAPLPVEEGDRVDVWATTDPSLSAGGLTTRRVAMGAVVASASKESVVVAVEPDDVADVTEAAALATVTLVLVS